MNDSPHVLESEASLLRIGSAAITLPSGRRLGIADYGSRNHVPVLFFHGFGGSRLQQHPNRGLAQSAGIRLIAVDRPGIGLSDRAAGRRVVDWAEDIRALADLLQLPRFGLFGWSAGAPHALACAHVLNERVIGVALASPMGRWFIGPGATRSVSKESRPLMLMARFAPWSVRVAMATLGRLVARNAESVVGRETAKLPELDREVVSTPAMRQMLIESLQETFRQGSAGMADDVLAVARPWGFEPGDVKSQVWIWQGLDDATVLPALARELAGQLPHSSLSLLPGEGHFLLFRHWVDILKRFSA